MLHDFLRQVRQAGLRIDHVYDIGAWNGRWSQTVQAQALPEAEFILFEANPACAPALRRTGFRSYCGVALSNPGRSSVQFFNGTNTGDSYYKETTRHYDAQGSITLPCITLDALKKADHLPTPQFIKMPLLNSVWVMAGVKGGRSPAKRTLDAGHHPVRYPSGRCGILTHRP